MNIWVFDIDGVLTNLESRKVSEELIKKLVRINKSGDPIAFVTGRAYAWVEKRIIDPLKNHSVDFDLILTSCEKGGVKVTYKEDKPVLQINKKLSLPEELKGAIKELFESKYQKTMMFDAPKYTMVSIEAREDVTIEQFRRDQKILNQELEKIIGKQPQAAQIRIDSSPISTDIENKNCSKGTGAADFIEWIREKSFNSDHIYTFGDLQSDIEVPTLLHQKGFSVTAVFTGGEEELKSRDVPFELVVTNELYDKGTLSFLRHTMY